MVLLLTLTTKAFLLSQSLHKSEKFSELSMHTTQLKTFKLLQQNIDYFIRVWFNCSH